MTSRRQLHLNVNALGAGFYASAWRHAGSDPVAFKDINHYIEIARIAERGTFDAIFLADVLAVADKAEYRPNVPLEPTVVLAAIAATTSHLGLIATASTSYNVPYNIARRFLSLDHMSGGRAGWNIVTTADVASARNFGLDRPDSNADRYARAAEFTDVVRKLWDSWDDDAILADKDSGRLVDAAKVHEVDHKGKYYASAGPLLLPRSPQGQPVRIQAGASDIGLSFAARVAEAVFTVAQTVEEAQTYAARLRTRAREVGRDGDGIVILPGLAYVLGGTEEEARRRQSELLDLIPEAYSMPRLAAILQVDVERLDPDRPLPDDLQPPPTGASQSFYHATVGLARRENLTVRELNRRLAGGAGHRVFVGTPEQFADDIQHWFETGVADGFNLMPSVLPTGLGEFVDEVVPLLRQRDIFRKAYEGKTLRSHLGLDIPGYYRDAAE
ncbi:MAG: LLM class flavin-dependent oxidoreductase [Rhizobium sp.]